MATCIRPEIEETLVLFPRSLAATVFYINWEKQNVSVKILVRLILEMNCFFRGCESSYKSLIEKRYGIYGITLCAY